MGGILGGILGDRAEIGCISGDRTVVGCMLGIMAVMCGIHGVRAVMGSILGVRSVMGGTWCQGCDWWCTGCQSSDTLITNEYRYQHAWYYLLALCGALYGL